MGEVERCSPTRVLLTEEEFVNLDKAQLLQHWMKQENYINWLETQLSTAQIGWIGSTLLFKKFVLFFLFHKHWLQEGILKKNWNIQFHLSLVEEKIFF